MRTRRQSIGPLAGPVVLLAAIAAPVAVIRLVGDGLPAPLPLLLACLTPVPAALAVLALALGVDVLRDVPEARAAAPIRLSHALYGQAAVFAVVPSVAAPSGLAALLGSLILAAVCTYAAHRLRRSSA